MSRHSERTASSPDDAEQARRQRILSEALEQSQQELLAGIRIYLWQLGAVTDRAAIEARAKEILHETVIKALQSAGNYQPERSARSWLLGVAINEIRHLRRTLQRERFFVTPIADTPQVRAAVSLSDSSGMSEAEMFDLLYAVAGYSHQKRQYTLDEILSVVNEDDRKVLRLHFVEGLSGRELAAALSASEGAAYTRLSRAKTHLRQAFISQRNKSEG